MRDDNAAKQTFRRRMTYAFFAFGAAAIALYYFGDIPIARFAEAHRKSGFSQLAGRVDDFGKLEWCLVPAGVILFYEWMTKRPRKPATTYFVCATTCAGIAAATLKAALGRCRPIAYLRDGLYGFHFFELDDDFRSFPSGHGTTAIAAGVALGFVAPRYRAYFWAIAALPSIARIVTVRHYPSDVVAAAWLGGTISVLFARSMLPTRDPRPEADDAC